MLDRGGALRSRLDLVKAGAYSVTLGNTLGTTNSDDATLTVLSLQEGTYAASVLNAVPLIYYRFSEAGSTKADDSTCQRFAGCVTRCRGFAFSQTGCVAVSRRGSPGGAVAKRGRWCRAGRRRQSQGHLSGQHRVPDQLVA